VAGQRSRRARGLSAPRLVQGGPQSSTTRQVRCPPCATKGARMAARYA
jgi:hypothetical protein